MGLYLKTAKQADIINTLITRQDQNWNVGTLLPGNDGGEPAEPCGQARTAPAQPWACLRAVLAPSPPFFLTTAKQWAACPSVRDKGGVNPALLLITAITFERLGSGHSWFLRALNTKTSDLQRSLLPEEKSLPKKLTQTLQRSI